MNGLPTALCPVIGFITRHRCGRTPRRLTKRNNAPHHGVIKAGNMNESKLAYFSFFLDGNLRQSKYQRGLSLMSVRWFFFSFLFFFYECKFRFACNKSMSQLSTLFGITLIFDTVSMGGKKETIVDAQTQPCRGEKIASAFRVANIFTQRQGSN